MNLIGLGAGGHGLSVWDAITSDGTDRLIGWLDDARLASSEWGGLPILGATDIWPEGAEGYTVTVGRDLLARRRLFDLWREIPHPVILHRSAVISPSCVIGNGSQILAFAYVGPEARVGLNVIINTRATIEHHCVVADHAHIAPGAILCGSVEVGEGAFVGAGAILLPRTRIAPGALVHAGAVIRL